MSFSNPGICWEFKIKETSTCSYRRKTFPGIKDIILIMPVRVCMLHSSCPIVLYWYAFFTLCSAPLKVVGRDFHWTLIFVLMFASIPVIDPMSAPLILATKGLHNQQISSHISWHMQKEQSNGRQIVILNNVCTDFQGKGETFRVIQEIQMTSWICRWSLVHFTLVFPSAAFASQILWNTQSWCAAYVLVSIAWK